eukprot:TRINITY_DN2763_c0_g1_i7.p1 TRINITY_DN2763_c0_g1~~TRINITY_DN2763_c0_g1_i7.p1  ORF type:complete len:442 (-),score=28.93 TRINITY_DN2763_c0_g1_i7:234-1559(-)
MTSSKIMNNPMPSLLTHVLSYRMQKPKEWRKFQKQLKQKAKKRVLLFYIFLEQVYPLQLVQYNYFYCLMKLACNGVFCKFYELEESSPQRIDTDCTLQNKQQEVNVQQNKSSLPDEDEILKMREMDQNIRSKNLNLYDIKSKIVQQRVSYVALCAIVRDEHLFIREWISYHDYIGVGKFYIYDHMSIPPIHPLIEDFINSGLVDYTFLQLQWINDDYNLDKRPFNYQGRIHVNSPQRWAHLDCFTKHGKNHQFMAMVDIDEFIVLNQGKNHNYAPTLSPNLPGFLKRFEGVGGVFIWWRHFGSSGYVERPDGLVLERYTQCENRLNSVNCRTKCIKHIVNMRFFLDMCIIHTCFTTVASVNADYVPFYAAGRIAPSWEGIALNHYIFKSLEDFEAKRSRGGGHMNMKTYLRWRGPREFKIVDNRAKGNCSEMALLANACCK